MNSVTGKDRWPILRWSVVTEIMFMLAIRGTIRSVRSRPTSGSCSEIQPLVTGLSTWKCFVKFQFGGEGHQMVVMQR